MTSTINTLTASTKAAAFAVFNDADKASASFAERLMALGIGDRTTAKPLAMEWAAKKYGAELKASQKGGMTFAERNTDAERAMYRVLSVCFPAVDCPKASAAGRASVDPVAKLLAAYAKLSAGEKRAFKAKFAKL